MHYCLTAARICGIMVDDFSSVAGGVGGLAKLPGGVVSSGSGALMMKFGAMYKTAIYC